MLVEKCNRGLYSRTVVIGLFNESRWDFNFTELGSFTASVYKTIILRCFFFLQVPLFVLLSSSSVVFSNIYSHIPLMLTHNFKLKRKTRSGIKLHFLLKTISMIDEYVPLIYRCKTWIGSEGFLLVRPSGSEAKHRAH